MIIKGGKAFIDGAFLEKDILIEGGKIRGIGAFSAGKIIDAKGMLVVPGLIDPHVHLREPGDSYKEDFLTGSRAAIAGGFTTVMDMPNNSVPTITAENYEKKKKLAKKAICDVILHFGATADNVSEVKKANPPSLKLYLAKTTGSLIVDLETAKKHFDSFPKERPIVLHACSDKEDEEENLKETYDLQQKVYRIARGRRLHLAHVSSKKEISMAKQHSNVTTEAAPHHLLLSTKDYPRLARMRNVLPTLKSPQKQIMLLSALEKVDCIGSDHAPHTIEDKDAGAAGFPGLETSLGAMLDLCNRGICDKIWLMQRMTENVADAFNLKDRGRLKPGYLADITIIDPKKEWEVRGADFETKCRWSPFEGFKFRGKAKTVIKNGKIIYDEYHFV
ncbi:dihydroorotase family protein [Candidatus Micrarchaeota archaeon]|nr:dihydroorotase family protein [Candidatus Micrarchaeota archaeon]